MPQTFQIPMPAQGTPPLTFPDRCVCCGEPKQSESTLAIKRLIMRGTKQKQITVNYQIPHCLACARSTKAVFLAGCIPFVVGFLVLGGLAFVATAFGASTLGLDTYGQPNNANSLLVGAAAGLIVGMLGGLLVELIARVILLPFFGQALVRAPLLAIQLLSDSDYVAGLSCKLDQDSAHVHLTFANDDIAHEFNAMNHLG